MKRFLFLINFLAFLCVSTANAQVFKTAGNHPFGTGANSCKDLADELEGGNVNGILKSRSFDITYQGTPVKLDEIDLYCILMIGIYNDLYVPLVPGTKPLNFEIGKYDEFYAVLRTVAYETPSNWKPGDKFQISSWKDNVMEAQWFTREVKPNELSIGLPIPGQSRENGFLWGNLNTCINPYLDERPRTATYNNSNSTTYTIPAGTTSLTINNNINVNAYGGSVNNSANNSSSTSPFGTTYDPYAPPVVYQQTPVVQNTGCTNCNTGCNNCGTNTTTQVVDPYAAENNALLLENTYYQKKTYQAATAGAIGSWVSPLLAEGMHQLFGRLFPMPVNVIGGGNNPNQNNLSPNPVGWNPTDWHW